MLRPSSVGRVAAAVCLSPCPVSLFSSFTPSATPAVVIGRRYASSHRRYSSSSKQSSSDSGSKKVATPASNDVTTVERPKSASDKKKSRRKAAKFTAPALPSVPDTNHLSPPAIALTSFFSLHRPISITDGFPSVVSDGTFASIFASSSAPQVPRDSVASGFADGHVTRMLLGPRTEHTTTVDGGASIYEQVEGALPGLFDQLKAMSGRFEPFRSPPTPGAEGEEGSSSVGMAEARRMPTKPSEMMAAAAEINPSMRRYKAIITIDKVTEADGSVNLVAHPDVLITPERDDQQMIERQQRRRIRYHLISVKRIRKLKMKKKKYKKLMKRTRNERRKLDRL